MPMNREYYREADPEAGLWLAAGGACWFVALLFPPTAGFGCSMLRVEG